MPEKEARVVHSPVHSSSIDQFVYVAMLFLLDHSSPFFRAVHFVDDCRHTRGTFPSWWTTNKIYEQIN